MSKNSFPMLLAIVVSIITMNAIPVSAQSTQTSVDGTTVVCFYPNGQPVRWFSNSELNDVGNTDHNGITSNPVVLARMSESLQLFWLGHECGHAHLNTMNESEADCWSAQTGVRQGWFDTSDAEELGREMVNNPGDRSHPPGPERVAHVIECMSQVRSGGGVSVRRIRRVPHKVPKDPTKENRDPNTMCESLAGVAAAADGEFKTITGIKETGVQSYTTVKLPDAKQCFIHTGSRPTYQCWFSRSSYKSLIDSVMSCFPDAHKTADDHATFIDLAAPLDAANIVFMINDDQATFRMTGKP